MSKGMLFNYSALAISLFCLYPATAAETIHTQSSQQMSSARTSIEAPRQFVLEQPGRPDMVDKQLRWQDHTPLQSTGFWVEKGETVVVDIDYQGDSLTPSPEFFVTTPDDRTNRYKHAFKKPLNKGQNIIISEKSGILYIATYNDPIAGDIKVSIRSGAKPFARYLLGVHNVQDYKQMLSEFSDIPYIELQSQRMMITLRRAKAVQYIGSDGPDAMLKSWDKIVTSAEEQYGLIDEDMKSPHQRIHHRFHWLDGISLPGIVNNDKCAGYMNSSSWRLQTCKEEAIGDVVSNKLLTSKEGWGPWHELGHQFQMIPMDWGTWDTEGNMTEVVVNLTSLYIQRELGIPSRLEYDRFWDESVFPYLNKSQRNYHQFDNLFGKVAMLWQLDLTFGKDFYARLGKTYREIPKKEQPANSDEKVQRFIVETSRQAGYNLTSFYEKWGLPLTQTTRQTLSALSLKTLDVPIWENRDNDIRYNLSEEIDKPLSDKLKNPYAENGNLTGWHLDKGQFRVVATQDGIKPAKGNYFFTARQNDSAAGNSSKDQMSQTIALDKSIVSHGEASATLKFKSNSWGDGDYGTVYLIARDSWGNKLKEKKIDTKSISRKWLDNKIVMALPADSTTLSVQVLATKKAGAMSDVHFDDFVLKVDNIDIDEPDNTAPVAKASVDPTTLTGAGKITLSAAGSYDPDGDILIYKWKQVAGPTVALNASNKMTATAQLNAVSKKTDYQFEVTVTDSHSAFSSHRVSMTQHPETISTTPAWNASKTYSTPCEKVSWKGKEWLNGWWTQGNKPGSDGTWGVWRELGTANMHYQCK